MSVLSITAPQFTLEDELIERETLEDDELLAATSDMYGNVEFDETQEMLDIGPIELETAIHDIPIEEKEAYLEACERCPEIIQSESNYIMFLRSENYNVWVSFISFFVVSAIKREREREREFNVFLCVWICLFFFLQRLLPKFTTTRIYVLRLLLFFFRNYFRLLLKD